MIEQFQGEYRWLSNFAKCTIELDGRIYPSVENAYQSAKCEDQNWKRYCETHRSGECKKMSYRIGLIEDWDIIKVKIMKKCLQQKYHREPYRSLLLKTGNEKIQEGNFWNDRFWGIDLKTNTGQNLLGQMIMDIREELSKEKK
jgi:hypothetical protein